VLQPIYHVASGVVNEISCYNWVVANFFLVASVFTSFNLVASVFASFNFSCKWVRNEFFFQLPEFFFSVTSPAVTEVGFLHLQVRLQLRFLVANRFATEFFRLQVGSQLTSFWLHRVFSNYKSGCNWDFFRLQGRLQLRFSVANEVATKIFF
jgi:hypothetical protein